MSEVRDNARARATDIRARIASDMTRTLSTHRMLYGSPSRPGDLVIDLVDDAMHHIETLLAEIAVMEEERQRE